MTYYEAAKRVLEQSDVPMKSNEIWEKACKLGYDKQIEETGRQNNPDFQMSKTPNLVLAQKYILISNIILTLLYLLKLERLNSF